MKRVYSDGESRRNYENNSAYKGKFLNPLFTGVGHWQGGQRPSRSKPTTGINSNGETAADVAKKELLKQQKRQQRELEELQQSEVCQCVELETASFSLIARCSHVAGDVFSRALL